MNLEVVVCHFQENIDWLHQLKRPYVVYNKNPKNHDKFQYNLANYGFDVQAYVIYILNNYHNLPDYVCFAQDHPFDHCGNFIDLVNNFNFDVEFEPLGLMYERTPTAPHPQYCHLHNALSLADKLGVQYSIPLKFISSAQCIVSKNLILKRSEDFYKNILSLFPRNKHITDVNFHLEYLWPTILSFADQLITTYQHGSPQYKIRPGGRK